VADPVADVEAVQQPPDPGCSVEAVYADPGGGVERAADPGAGVEAATSAAALVLRRRRG